MKKSILLVVFALIVTAATAQTAMINGSNSSATNVCVGLTKTVTASITGGFQANDTLTWIQQINGGGGVVISRNVYTANSVITVPRDPLIPANVLPAVLGNTYYYTLIVKRGGSNYLANITITVAPLPTATVTPNDTNICYGTTITLNSNTNVGYTYQWQSSSDGGQIIPWADILGQTTSTYVAASTSYYRIKITDSNGCVNYSN